MVEPELYQVWCWESDRRPFVPSSGSPQALEHKQRAFQETDCIELHDRCFLNLEYDPTGTHVDLFVPVGVDPNDPDAPV